MRTISVVCVLGGVTVAGCVGDDSNMSPIDAGTDLLTTDQFVGPDSDVNDSASDHQPGAAATPSMLSCAVAGSGRTNCGSGSESCCTSLPVTGGTYNRTYTNTGSGPTGEANPASVSNFQLDKYEVTVGRFRQFVAAWNGGTGWTPPSGSGKHAHLNGGAGLSATAGGYEGGWVTTDDASIAPTNSNLSCATDYATWTACAGSNENRPINCVNWWEAYAFCIWDGGFLPSEAEWEYAAAGGSQELEYPWGATNPGTASQYAIYGCFYPSGAGSCTQGPLNVAPVGTPTLGAGRWGQLDLAGNVFEWGLDWSSGYIGSCVDCTDLTPASNRVRRGGEFAIGTSYMMASDREDWAPTVRHNDLGFRCARTP